MNSGSLNFLFSFQYIENNREYNCFLLSQSAFFGEWLWIRSCRDWNSSTNPSRSEERPDYMHHAHKSMWVLSIMLLVRSPWQCLSQGRGLCSSGPVVWMLISWKMKGEPRGPDDFYDGLLSIDCYKHGDQGTGIAHPACIWAPTGFSLNKPCGWWRLVWWLVTVL